MSLSPAEAKAKVDEARKNVQECEMEMQMLKTKIRELGTDGGDPNSLELAVSKVSEISQKR
jgi:archaellum component FlaC